MKLSKYERRFFVPPAAAGPAKERRFFTAPRIVLASVLALVAVGVGAQLWNSQVGNASASNPPSGMEKQFFDDQGTPIPKEKYVVLGVEVSETAVNVGSYPLNTGVYHEFKLKNSGTTTVFLGKPEIEVLQGCCPSDPILKVSRLAPGEEAPLIFALPMGMHAGMDGKHLFRVSVQMGNEAGERGIVEVYVKANFRAGAKGDLSHNTGNTGSDSSHSHAEAAPTQGLQAK